MLSSKPMNDPVSRSENLSIQEVVALLSSRKGQHVHVQRWVCEACGMIHTTISPAACKDTQTASLHLYPEVPLD